MVDGIKCWNVESSIENDQLEIFGLRFRRNKHSNHTISGSIHKYFNNGHHNADDFTLSKAKKCFNDLYDNFSINPAITKLNSVEFGVNILLPVDITTALQSILLYKNQTGSRGKNDIKFSFDSYILKIYSKSAIGSSNLFQTGNLLRIEIRSRNMCFFKKYNIEIDFLSDLLNKEMFELFEQILKNAINVCTIGFLTEQDIKNLTKEQLSFYYKHTNSNYLLKLEGSSKHRALKKLETFITEHSSVNLKDVILNLIHDKCVELRDVEIANRIDKSWKENTINVKNDSEKKRCFYSNSLTKASSSKWKENTIQIKGVFVPTQSKFSTYCKGCGKEIFNPRKDQVYCSALDVGKAAAQKCRDRFNKPLQRIAKKYNDISFYPSLFDFHPYLNQEYLLILERQNIIKHKHNKSTINNLKQKVK